MTLKKLFDEMMASKDRVKKALEEQFPIDMEIQVYLNCRQHFPTTMKVIGHNGNGYVRASMTSPRAKCGLFVKDIFYTNILD